MDTKDFIVSRTELVERMESRRRSDLSSYPFRMVEHYGVKFPAWARLALSFLSQGGALSRMMEISMPFVVPYIFRKQMPLVDRLVQRIFSRKS